MAKFLVHAELLYELPQRGPLLFEPFPDPRVQEKSGSHYMMYFSLPGVVLFEVRLLAKYLVCESHSESISPRAGEI